MATHAPPSDEIARVEALTRYRILDSPPDPAFDDLVHLAAALCHAPIAVLTSDEVGIPSNAREAMAFAVLADMTLRGVAAWLPPVTGASHPKLLGKLCFP